MPKTLLLVDLDEAKNNPFYHGFLSEGFVVDSAYRPQNALAMMGMRRYDAVIVFSESAHSVLKLLLRLREIIFLTPAFLCISNASPEDEMLLLDAGISICRPPTTTFAELLAQTRAVLTRVKGYPNHHRIGDLGIDPIQRLASRKGVRIKLRPIEFDILIYLAEAGGQPVSPEQLIRHLWPAAEASKGLLAVHMANLRRAIDSGRSKKLIHTIRNVGYVLRESKCVRC